jgi:hypothetical protein
MVLLLLHLLLLCVSSTVYSMHVEVCSPKELKQTDVRVIKRGMCDPSLLIACCKDGSRVYAGKAQVFRSVKDELHEYKYSYIIMDPKYLTFINQWFLLQERK